MHVREKKKKSQQNFLDFSNFLLPVTQNNVGFRFHGIYLQLLRKVISSSPFFPTC